jgi:hypothetical protein
MKKNWGYLTRSELSAPHFVLAKPLIISKLLEHFSFKYEEQKKVYYQILHLGIEFLSQLQ